MDPIIALVAVGVLSYGVCAMITYLFGWCVFHVNGVERKLLLIILSVFWFVGIFYVCYEGQE